MKFPRFSTILNFSTRFALRNVLGVLSYSYSTKTTPIQKKPWKGFMNDLYRRISSLGNPEVSIVPVLDQWVEEGRAVYKDQLVVFIKELRHYKRFSHALELSMWMSDKRFFPLSSRDIAIRLDLIAKVRGIEQAENYFNNIPKQLKLLEVHGALLNCYAHVKSVEKAEAVMQKMRDLGLARTSLSYNVLLNLYYQTGHHDKVDALMHEMEENGIGCDKFTFAIRLSAYAAASDIAGIEKILTRMESDSNVVLDWTSYGTVASAYSKAGFVDKALAMLKKSEGLISASKKSRTAFDYLLTQYAATGMKDEVLRLWDLYKKEKIYNRGYMCIIPSLLKFDDLESAEKIFEEWESRNLHYDIRIPNFLIGAYSRKGLLEKAETLINRAILKGGKPDAVTWYYLATGYLENSQTPKAVEAMKKAIMACRPRWKPNKVTLAACLEYLRGEGDLEEAEEFMRLLRDKNIFTADVHNRLLSYVKDGKSDSSALDEMEGDALVGKGTLGSLELVEDSSSKLEKLD